MVSGEAVGEVERAMAGEGRGGDVIRGRRIDSSSNCTVSYRLYRVLLFVC